MAEKPILFSGEMVRAILDGKKTQTRRVIKDLPDNHPDGLRDAAPAFFEGKGWYLPTAKGYKPYYCNPGDLLWVRETWRPFTAAGSIDAAVQYKADSRIEQVSMTADYIDRFPESPGRWRPSIHMPRWASRITLRVTDVQVERARNISEADAKAEGITKDRPNGWVSCESHRMLFRRLWDSINGPRGFGWEANPWVWVVEFELLR